MSKFDFSGFTKFVPPENKPSISRRTLRKSQSALYELLDKKIAQGKPVTLVEARKIWVEKSCRNVINGKPCMYRWRYDAETGKYRAELEVMTESEINFTVMDWLTRTIGILVMRGYLQIIPMIKLVD